MIGKTISHYQILEKLGQGGMGVVYKAEDTKLKRTVALKFLPPEWTRDPEAKERFINEARAAAAISHPNICTVHEIDEVEGQTFIAMEYIEGMSLKDRIESDNIMTNDSSLFPIEDAIEITARIAGGLLKAHEKGIIHRDIKPGNIMMTLDGQVKIVDFGLAKLGGVSRLTRQGTTLGTVAYMSPEQTRGDPVDHRTDIWALGVVLYEMITGVLPFRGEYEQAIIYSILSEEPEPAISLRADISPDLEQVLSKALAKKPEHRYDSATELLIDIGHLKTGISIQSSYIERDDSKAKENSVAVVDFANISGEPEVDWLSGGIGETVTVDLKKISSLNVFSREMVLKALGSSAGKSISEHQITALGNKLGAKWILWGGYQKIGEAIRITAHFTDVSTGHVLGTSKVDGIMNDIFNLQDQIIANMMDTLQFQITDSEVRKITKPETIQVEAYEYYAKGKQLFNQFGRTSWDQAQEFFQKAVEIDPQYALAHSGLGSIHIFRFIEQTDPRDFDIGLSHLNKAIRFDPDIADPHVWLTYAYSRNMEFEKAIDAGLRAIELESDNFLALYLLGITNLNQAAMANKTEQYTEAVRYLNRSIALQPHAQPPHMAIAWIYMLHGQYKEAELHLHKAVDIEMSGKHEGAKFVGAQTLRGNLCFRSGELEDASDWYQRSLTYLENLDHVYKDQFVAWSYCGLGDIHFTQKRYDEALQYFKSACELIIARPKAIGMGYCFVRGKLGMAKAFHKLGMTREEKNHFREAFELQHHKKGFDFNWIWEGSDAQSYYYIADYFATINQKEKAFECLEKAIHCGWADISFLKTDENLSSLREMSGYQEIIRDLASHKALS